MDKRRAIQIMTKAAQLYKEHLEDIYWKIFRANVNCAIGVEFNDLIEALKEQLTLVEF